MNGAFLVNVGLIWMLGIVVLGAIGLMEAIWRVDRTLFWTLCALAAPLVLILIGSLI